MKDEENVFVLLRFNFARTTREKLVRFRRVTIDNHVANQCNQKYNRINLFLVFKCRENPRRERIRWIPPFSDRPRFQNLPKTRVANQLEDWNEQKWPSTKSPTIQNYCRRIIADNRRNRGSETLPICPRPSFTRHGQLLRLVSCLATWATCRMHHYHFSNLERLQILICRQNLGLLHEERQNTRRSGFLTGEN